MALSRNIKNRWKALKWLIKEQTPLLLCLLMALIACLLSLQAPKLYNYWLVKKNAPMVLKITLVDNSESGGTAFFIKTKIGVKILTNTHICNHLENGIGIGESSTQPKQLVYVEKYSEKNDLCLLSGIYSKKGLELAESLERLDYVSILGHPSLDPLTLSQGYVIERVITPIADIEKLLVGCNLNGYKLIEGMCYHFQNSWVLSAQIYPGNSGSPVLNVFGDVVGVVFASDGLAHKARIVGLDEIKEFLGES